MKKFLIFIVISLLVTVSFQEYSAENDKIATNDI